MELIVTRADNSNYNLPSENSKITSAVQTRTLMGEDTVAMTVQSVGYINFLIGDWIEVFGRKYTLNTLGEPQRIGENAFEYNLVFEGVNYELTKVVYRSADYSGFNPTSDFPLTGTAESFLTVLQYNLDRAFGQGVWAIGSFPATEAKTLSFTSENCLLALNRVCSEFGLEYEIKTIGGGKTINLGAVGDTLPLNLGYGKGKGLYSLTRTNVDSKNIVTRLYVEGSDRNVKAGYRDNALRLRIAANAESYIDSPSVASFGVIEGSKIFEDIFPHREGTVSAINASDILEFTDSSMDFDLAETDSNGTKWLIAGQSAKIHFNTGALAGYEFELTSYNHSTKTFKLKPFKDERGLQFPNPDSAAFQIKTGDKYVILGIIMPDSYIQAAEAELLARAQEYLSQNDQPRVEYALELDRFFLKSMFSGPGFDVNFLDAGDYLHIKDSKIGVDKEVRVKTFTRDVIDPWAYQVALSDVIEPTRIELLLADTLETKKAARQIKLFDPARSRRNWRDVEEVAGMVDTLRAEVALIGSPEGQFQLDSFFEVNKGGNPDSFGATAGVLAHDAFEGDAGSIWNIGAFDVALSNSGAYYLYAQCSRVNTGAVFTVSLTKIGVEDVGGYYHFPVGIISSVKDNARTLTTVYGYTLISGNNINTGIIQNQISGIYINLQTGDIQGKFTFRSGRDVEEVIEEVEGSIEDQQIYVEYSVNGSSNWHTTFASGDIYMRQKKGNGAWSAAIRIVGEAGAAGATGPEGRYTDYQFAKNTSATTAPTSGWQDSPPAISAGEYVWMRTGEVVPPAISPSSWSMATRVTGDKGAKGDKGDQGVQGIPGTPGANGVTYYTWVKYADSPTTGMSDYPSGKAYIGIAHNKTTATESSNYADYAWALIKGTDGQPGAPGANGQTLYTWIKYADTPTSGMSDSPTGKTYIGLAVNKTTASESSSYGDYTWSLIKGADGRSVTGTDVEFAQSTSATVAPTSGWQTTAPAWESGKYIWHRTKTTYSTGDPTYSAAVNLTGSPGSTGSTGATGTGVDSITEEYYLSTSKTTQAGGSWSVNPPTWEMGKYMWTRVKIVYKDPASTVYTTPVVSSEWEAVDAVQVGGRNLFFKSGFSSGTSGNGITGWGGYGSTLLQIENDKPFLAPGVNAVSWVISSAVSNGGYYQRFRSPDGGSITDYFQQGQRYTVSAWLKASAPSTFRIAAEGVSGGTAYLSLTTEWQLYTHTFVGDSSRHTVAFYGYTQGVRYYMCMPKLEIGNRATDWTPAPEDVDADIAAAQTAADNANASVTSLNTYVDGAFKDGVIDTAEAKAIEKYKNSLSETKLSVDGSYTQLYNNAYLTGTPKSNLSAVKTALNTAYTNLVNSINTAIADGKTTAAEKSDVDSKFGLFNTALATYRVRVEEANAAIQVAVESNAKAYTDSIEYVGRNLALGTNKGTKNWRWAMQAGGATLSSVFEDHVHTCLMTRNSSAAGSWSLIAFEQIQPHLLQPGAVYTATLMVKASVVTTFYARIIRGNGTDEMAYPVSADKPTVVGQWTKIKFTIQMYQNPPAGVPGGQWLYLTMNSNPGVTYQFKDLKFEKGTRITDWTPAPEDVPSAMDYLATAIQDGSTDIEGGLLSTNILKVKDTSGAVTGGMSGLSNDNVGFWAGGSYQDALDSLSKVLFRKDGSGQLAGGIVKFSEFGDTDIGDIKVGASGELGIYENQEVRVLLSRQNISTLSEIASATQDSKVDNESMSLTGVFYEYQYYNQPKGIVTVMDNTPTNVIGSFSIGISTKSGFRLSQGRATITVFIGLSSQNSIAQLGSATVQVDKLSGEAATNHSGIINFSRNVNLPVAGTYRIYAKIHFEGMGNESASTERDFYIVQGYLGDSSMHAKKDAARRITEIGKNGVGIISNANNYSFFGVEGGVYKIVEKTTGVYDRPGVLLAGRMESGGVVSSWWGAKVGSSSGKTGTAGEYQINHTIGHTNYFVSAIPTSNVTLRLTAKTNTYFRIRSSSSADVTFDYSAVGDNK